MIHYFAYGSNMDENDFQRWCNGNNKSKKQYPMPNFQNIRPAKLKGYKLTFNYYSCSRKAGAANIMKNDESCVYGLLMEIDNNDLQTIRNKEGYSKDLSNRHYDEICIDVEQLSDKKVVQNVKTYKVIKELEKPDQQPTEEYLCLIIKNAVKFKFPPVYIEHIIIEAGI